MPNAYTGEVELVFGATRWTLVYDWRAIAALRTAFGERDVNTVLASAAPEELAQLLAAGLRRHQPEITAEQVMDASPPLNPSVEAVVKALRFAYWGAGGPPAARPEENKPENPTSQPTP